MYSLSGGSIPCEICADNSCILSKKATTKKSATFIKQQNLVERAVITAKVKFDVDGMKYDWRIQKPPK